MSFDQWSVHEIARVTPVPSDIPLWVVLVTTLEVVTKKKRQRGTPPLVDANKRCVSAMSLSFDRSYLPEAAVLNAVAYAPPYVLFPG